MSNETLFTTNLKTVQIGRITYTFNLANTSKIEDWDAIRPYASAVENFIEGYNLPSFAFPEVYEFFVIQRGCLISNNISGYSVFETEYTVSTKEEEGLIKAIQELDKENRLYFQKKNKELK